MKFILSFLQRPPSRPRERRRDHLVYVKQKLPDGCEAKRCVFGLRCSNLSCIRSQMGHSSRPPGEPWNPYYDCPLQPDDAPAPRGLSYYAPGRKSAAHIYYQRPTR
jgi:hypothetical protein